jgi:hypothetical protein
MRTIVLSLFLSLGVYASATDLVVLSVEIDTPHPGYKLEILRVDDTGEGFSVLAEVISPPANSLYPAVIDKATDTVQIASPPKPITLYIMGRTWNWGGESVVESEAAYLKIIKDSFSILFERP